LQIIFIILETVLETGYIEGCFHAKFSRAYSYQKLTKEVYPIHLASITIGNKKKVEWIHPFQKHFASLFWLFQKKINRSKLPGYIPHPFCGEE